jgi:hypothetical protein
MPIFYLRFVAHLKHTHPKFHESGGAMVNCWILRDTLKEAESYARGCIADEDWRITELEAAFAVTRETQADEGMQYFDQAEIDREVFVFHTFPLGAQDDGTPTI